MVNKNNYSAPSGETEELVLDEAEFESLLGEGEEVIYEDFEEPATEVVYETVELPEIEEESFEDGLYEDDLSEEEYEDDFEDEPEQETVVYSKKEVKKAVYEDDDEDDEDDEDASVVNIFSSAFADKLIYLTGALIVLCAIIVGVVLLTGKTRRSIAGPDMGDIGLSLSSIELIGGQGINSVFGGEADRISALFEAAESFEYTEVDEETGLVNVTLALTSIQKDLKIKFVNRNNKLVANVPFKAEVTDSKGNTKTYTDDDKDGIIYLTDIAGGEYTVKMIPLDTFDALYAFSTDPATIKVKDQIEYAKVDVSNEIKKESQADSKEKKTDNHDTEVEGVLQDTVEFVTSSKTAAGGSDAGFTKVSKDTIKDPRKAYSSAGGMLPGRFRKLSGTADPGTTDPGTGDPNPLENVSVSISGPDSVNAGETATFSVAVNGTATIKDVSWSGADQDAADKTTAKLTIAETSTDTSASVSVSVTFEEGTDTKSASKTVTIVPKQTEDKSNFSVSGIPSTMNVGDTATASFSAVGKDGATLALSECTIACTSDNTAVATISNDGKITAVKAGTANLTITCQSAKMGKDFTATASITVAAGSYAIKLDNTSLKVFFQGNENYSLKATVYDTNTNAEITGKTLVWTSSDESVITVSGGALTLLKTGSAEITVALSDDNTKTAKCSVTVVLDPSKDTVTKLLDSNGNVVYVKKDGKYVEATYADYYTSTDFYLATKVDYKYTGWQTFDGKTYYYDKNGNKVTGDQVILGTKYSFGSDGALISGSGVFGIDVSSYQGVIDWNAVAKSGVSYAIIRCGLRGSTVGGLFEDSKFYTNIKNATNAGIKVGVYFFSQAKNEVEAVEEASMVLHMVQGYNITYPIFLDVESSDISPNGRADGLDPAERTKVINAFCQTIANSGYKAGFYANKTWLNSKINTSQLTQYKIWLAQYNSSVTYSATRYDLWQYSSSGSISGISGRVDLDHSYLGY